MFDFWGLLVERGGGEVEASQLAWQRYLWRAASVIQRSALSVTGGKSRTACRPQQAAEFQVAYSEFWST